MDKSLDDIIASKEPRRETGGPKHRKNRNEPRRAPMLTLVEIRNLFYGLTEDDLRDLFSRVGPVDDVKIRYDRSGRSEGIAWILYGKMAHSFQAVERFNGKKAAGQEIQLSIVRGDIIQLAKPSYVTKSRDEVNRLARRLNPLPNSGISKSGKKPRAKKTKLPKSVEDLDKELAAYMGNSAPSDVQSGDQGAQPEAGQHDAPDNEMLLD